MISLARLYAAAHLDTDEPVRRLVRALGHKAAPLVLSVAVAEGHRPGPATSLLLERQRLRADTYQQALRGLRDVADITVLKGPAIAAHYPPEMLRPVGDLDLVVRSEAHLWAAARFLVSAHGAAPSTFTVIRHEGSEQCFLSLTWPTDDPLSEKEYEVEISTFAYAGDQAGIPLRVPCPPSDLLTQLFAIAEERCQGEFSVKDAVDGLVLFAADPQALEKQDAADLVRRFHVAPELHELLMLAADLFGATVPAVLDPLAAEERERRRLANAGSVTHLVDGRWSVADNARYGIPLDAFAGPTAGRESVGQVPGGELIRTPVGGFLMVAGAEVEAADVDAARQMSAALHTAAAA